MQKIHIISYKFLKKLFWSGLIIIMGACISAYAKQPKKDPGLIEHHPRLIVGVSADYPPFEFKQGYEFVGLDIDLIRLIGKRLNREIEFKDLSLNNLFIALNSGQIDLAISTISFTEARNKNFSLSKPYYFANIAIMFNNNYPINNISELDNKKIGAQLGSTMEAWAKENAPKAKLVTMDLNSQLIEALKSKQLDLIVVEDLQAKEFCQRNPDLGYIVAAKSNNGYVIALKKNSLLLKDIDTVLEQIKQEGDFIKLKQKWLEMMWEMEVHDAS